MNEKTNTPLKSSTTEKPGFFTRILTKMDSAMKTKADEKSKESCCGKDSKGNKCC